MTIANEIRNAESRRYQFPEAIVMHIPGVGECEARNGEKGRERGTGITGVLTEREEIGGLPGTLSHGVAAVTAGMFQVNGSQHGRGIWSASKRWRAANASNAAAKH